MERRNEIVSCVKSKYTLYSDPLNRISGEEFSYQIPTYEVLEGIVKSIYFKPTVSWFIDEVHIMNEIQFTTQDIRPINCHGGNILSHYTYLTDVEYQAKAHFGRNLHHEELEQDHNKNKHWLITRRMVNRGERRDIFLDTRECQAYVEPCEFGEGRGFCDDHTIMPFSTMVHGFIYPNEWIYEEEKGKLVTTFWTPVMEKSITTFIRPEQCAIRCIVGAGDIKRFEKDIDFESVEHEEGGELYELGE